MDERLMLLAGRLGPSQEELREAALAKFGDLAQALFWDQAKYIPRHPDIRRRGEGLIQCYVEIIPDTQAGSLFEFLDAAKRLLPEAMRQLGGVVAAADEIYTLELPMGLTDARICDNLRVCIGYRMDTDDYAARIDVLVRGPIREEFNQGKVRHA